jgi:hypothetical protein
MSAVVGVKSCVLERIGHILALSAHRVGVFASCGEVKRKHSYDEE